MLVVDDEREICSLLEDFFTSRGFTVVSAFSGEEALERLADGAPDVILLDILLPGISGLEVLKRAKRTYPRAKIVMVTALDEDDLRSQAHQFGAAEYITKPFDFSDQAWQRVL
jgi:DNA-binding response OmpR family regulator